jgi:hypothetical protein
MKSIGYLICIIILAACNSKNKPTGATQAGAVDAKKKSGQPTVFKAYQINSVYTAIDTGKYSNDGPMSGGSYAIIQKNGTIADTINLNYGIKEINAGTYLYQTLKPEKERHQKLSKGELAMAEGNYILITGDAKLLLKDKTQNFDDYFSSPSAINNKIYFWQLEKGAPDDKMKISAAEFDIATGKTANHFLLNDVLDTDDSGYFPQPYLDKDTIIFTMDGIKKWKFSSQFKAY